ncbi:ATP-binding protein [Tistrella mobilis]|uniref:ATP-binding protein n=1 Tax=Tistrella mobilis TaxID=171437 RepID=UPI0035572BF7
MVEATSEPQQDEWPRVGTVVGEASTGRYTFILRNLKGKLGDIVATRVEVPVASDNRRQIATVWGRITSINRFNPFFPAEAAQELANENINFLDTVLSGSRDHLEAEVLILGTTFGDDPGTAQLSPLTYPVKPSAEVLYPSADAVKRLLTGDDDRASPAPAKLLVGSLIARGDVEVSLSARDIVSRHLAILAMTGGGKTVAARRIIRELIELNYPLVIFDPHGDYLGFYEKRDHFPDIRIRILYPIIRVRQENLNIISDLIDKMGKKLTDAQQQFYLHLLNNAKVTDGEAASSFLRKMINHAEAAIAKKRRKDGEDLSEDLADTRTGTMSAVKRSLDFILANLEQMESNNERLRNQSRFSGYEFEEMPDPSDTPDEIVAPGTVSIFYLAGYDHLNQSAIVSMVLEALFGHRSTLSGIIPPFQAVVEEAHNFIPSRQEGVDGTPSLPTIRKVITEGRKFGTGLILISQRPSRLDETTLAQCNSFLVLRLVNPRDKSFVRSVMENLSEADADILQAFGRGQGIVSGQAVRFPLLVQVKFDADLVSKAIGDEDFIQEARNWQPDARRQANTAAIRNNLHKPEKPSDSSARDEPQRATRSTKPKLGRRGGIRPDY